MYTEDLVVQRACEQSGCVPNYTTTPSLLLQWPGTRLLRLFSRFHLSFSLSCGTAGPCTCIYTFGFAAFVLRMLGFGLLTTLAKAFSMVLASLQ